MALNGHDLETLEIGHYKDDVWTEVMKNDQNLKLIRFSRH